jgi:hypothetical protein
MTCHWRRRLSFASDCLIALASSAVAGGKQFSMPLNDPDIANDYGILQGCGANALVQPANDGALRENGDAEPGLNPCQCGGMIVYLEGRSIEQLHVCDSMLSGGQQQRGAIARLL